MNTNHYPSFDRCLKLTELTDKADIEGRNTFGTERQYYQFRNKPETLRLVENFGPIASKEDFVAWCPSVMEMLDVIPYSLDEDWYIQIQKFSEKYMVTYKHYDDDIGDRYCEQESLPNALADLIFWLVENGYLTFKK